MGKSIISELGTHIKSSHSSYLTIIDQQDLQITVAFFGIKIRIAAIIYLDRKDNDDYKIEAYLLPEKEKDKPEKQVKKENDTLEKPIVRFQFDYLGNVNKAYTPKEAPIHIVNKIINEIVDRRTPMRPILVDPAC